MKPSVLITVGLVLFSAFIFWRLRAPKTGQLQPANRAESVAQPAQPATSSSGTVPIPSAAEIARLQARTKEQHESFRAAFATPRNLYGIVVDETETPIPGARVHVSANDKPFSEKGTKYELTSDANGRFSIIGKPGASFYVEVSKEGYYTYAASKGSIDYAIKGDPQSRPPPSPDIPAKFILRKKGEPAELIYFQRYCKVAKDGTPYEISFTTGKQTPLGEGDLRVEAWTYDQGVAPGARFDWKCRISVPGGGLIERTGALNFEAPESGYVPSAEYDRKSLEQGLPGGSLKHYFVKTREGKYARIEFEMRAGGENFFTLRSYLNPSGSRNLESDPNKRGL